MPDLQAATMAGKTMTGSTGHATDGIDLAAGVRRPSSYRYELECLRGLAILLVFLFHAYGVTWGAENAQVTPANAWIIAGNTGVTLFFVLSGFLLSLPWLQAEGGKSRPSLRGFYRARCMRILPLYLCAVALAALITGDWEAASRAALFQPIGFEMFPFGVVWWTLCTEVQFYILLPLAFWCVYRHPALKTLVILILGIWLAAYLYWALAWAPTQSKVGWWASKSLAGRLPAFLAGIALAFWYARLAKASPSSQLPVSSTGALVAILAAMTYLLWRSATIGDAAAERQWHIHHTLEATCWAALIALLLVARPLGSSVVLNRPMAVLGKLSYSIYLNHLPILFYLIYPLKHTPGYADSAWAYLIQALALGLSLFLGWITYRYIELPFLRRKASGTVANTAVAGS
ncbi:acyltransferase family protein [Parahaliea mediterranea]|uniref:acyltransferase family protein n=1 Tax=Parahaliea mediterranea TaxID=651086 RepID=UPI000E2FA73B|nr:acyltransferase [Parahaliea mediterranea]